MNNLFRGFAFFVYGIQQANEGIEGWKNIKQSISSAWEALS